MKVLKIIGWMFVVWWTIGIIGSSYYHMSNYLPNRGNEHIVAKYLTGPESEAILTPGEYLKEIAILQVYKLSMVSIVLFFLLKKRIVSTIRMLRKK